jgi:hypothetical protein
MLKFIPEDGTIQTSKKIKRASTKAIHERHQTLSQKTFMSSFGLYPDDLRISLMLPYT